MPWRTPTPMNTIIYMVRSNDWDLKLTNTLAQRRVAKHNIAQLFRPRIYRFIHQAILFRAITTYNNNSICGAKLTKRSQMCAYVDVNENKWTCICIRYYGMELNCEMEWIIKWICYMATKLVYWRSFMDMWHSIPHLHTMTVWNSLFITWSFVNLWITCWLYF